METARSTAALPDPCGSAATAVGAGSPSGTGTGSPSGTGTGSPSGTGAQGSPGRSNGSSGGSSAAGRGRATAARRRARQREIVASTRELFDARGMRAANIDDIARAVGINRAIIYRHFASKEELFALALAEYLIELDERLSTVDDVAAAPADRLAAVSRVFAEYCLRYPAFVDCALALLGRPGPDLLEEISDVALLRLGGLMAAQLRRIAGILAGREPGAAGVDPDLLANALYMQVLGVTHLARSGVMLRPMPGGEVSWGTVANDQIVELVVRMALAVAFG
jgi:AcrR family transcriptional regulator